MFPQWDNAKVPVHKISSPVPINQTSARADPAPLDFPDAIARPRDPPKCEALLENPRFLFASQTETGRPPLHTRNNAIHRVPETQKKTGISRNETDRLP